jgi:hypothetical protein
MWQRGWALSIISFFDSHCVTVSVSADRAQGFAKGLLTACPFRLSALPISGKNWVDFRLAAFGQGLQKADVDAALTAAYYFARVEAGSEMK